MLASVEVTLFRTFFSEELPSVVNVGSFVCHVPTGMRLVHWAARLIFFYQMQFFG